MRATQIAVRAGLVCGAAGLAIAAWSALDDTAAYAADKPPVVEQAGGLLHHQLPEQAADHAQDVVDQVAPPKPSKPKHDQPAHEAKPEPPARPDPPKAEPKPAPVEGPGEEPAPAEDQPAPAPDPGVDVPPLDLSPVVTLPATDPAPLPDAEDVAPVLTPLPAVKPSPVIPGALPVTVAPAPAIVPPAGAAAALITASTSAGPDEPAVCESDPDDARQSSRDALRALLGVHDEQPAAAEQDRPAKPCPGSPAPTGSATAGLAMVPAAAVGLSVPAATVPARAAELVLQRLYQLRPRSDLPPGRTTHLDPGPA